MGVLYVDGAYMAFTLEDEIREVAGQPVEAWKVPGTTCIPAGRYRVMLTWSPHFQRILPELVSVPGFSDIRLHSGNWTKDTVGCPLVGFLRAHASIVGGTSLPAEHALVVKWHESAAARDEVWIVIDNPPQYVLGV
jgi:hypothetical protein